jgi:hypothetical protein
MHVEIRDIENDEDHLVGILRLKEGKIVPEPDSLLLRNILAEPVFDWEAMELYYPRKQPEEFLRALHLQYRSAYLRASQVIE